MSTGDLANNLRKLQRELKQIKFSEDVDLAGLSQGAPTAFLPIYHYLFTSYSHSIAELVSSSDTELFGKTDVRFIEAVYKLMRDMFSYKPPVTKDQFFNPGYAERKIIMCADVVQMIREKNRSLQPNRKPTTTAVSSLSHLNKKTTRPKTADSAKTTKVQPLPSKAPTHPGEQKHVKFATEGVVNELYQPVKHEASRHIAHKEPPSPVTIVNMSPVVTKEVVDMDDHRGFKHAVVTPAVAKLPFKSSRSRETNVNKGLTFQESGDIEVVNAITPDTSLYEPLHSTGINHDEDLILSLNQAVEAISERLSLVETSAKETNTTDPKLMELISTLQKQIENITARMVLIENRVSIIESKIDTGVTLPSNRNPSSDKMPQKDANRNYVPTEFRPTENLPSQSAQGIKSPNVVTSTTFHEQSSKETVSNRLTEVSRVKPQLSQGQPVDSYSASEGQSSDDRRMYAQGQSSDDRRMYAQGQSSDDRRMYAQGQSSDDRRMYAQGQSSDDRGMYAQGQSSDDQRMYAQGVGPQTGMETLTDNENTTLIGEQYKYLISNGDSCNHFSFALSPIRQIKDMSGLKTASAGEDTFALETEDDARRSSTPTDFKDLPLKPPAGDDLSFQCGDVSMQQRVDRIKNMMASTKSMLNK